MNAEKTAKRFMQRVSQSCTGMNPQREFELLQQLVNIINTAQQSVQPTVATESLEDSPWETGARRGAVILPTRNSG